MGSTAPLSPEPATPRELLDWLVASTAAHPAYPTEISAEQLDMVVTKLGLPAEQRPQLSEMQRYRLEVVRNQLVELVQPLPEGLREALLDERFCLAMLLPVAELNAHALRAGNGGWLIVVNQGVMGFVYKVARALGRHFAFEDGAGEPGTREREPADLRLAAELVATTFDWYLETGVPLGPDFPIEPAQVEVASRITAEAEKFVLGHELGHHILGHLDLGTEAMMVSGTSVEALAVGKAEEFEADAAGLRLRLEAIQTEGPVEYAFAYAGVELFFRALDMLEAYQAAPESETHPPARDRLERIRAEVRELVPPEAQGALTSLADALAQLLERVRPMVLDPGRRALQAQERPGFEAFLDGLVEEHVATGSEVETFLDALTPRLYDYPPAVICDVFADRLDSLRAAAAAAGSEDEARRVSARGQLVLAAIVLHEPLRVGVEARTQL